MKWQEVKNPNNLKIEYFNPHEKKWYDNGWYCDNSEVLLNHAINNGYKIRFKVENT